LLDLPPELRNTVYELTLVSETPIKPLEDRQQPAISNLCRQIRAESLPVYYSVNSFVLENFHYPCNYMKDKLHGRCSCTKHGRYADWLAAIGYTNLRHMQTLRKVNGWDFDVTLKQDLTRKQLIASRESRWTEYSDNWPWRLNPEYCTGPKSPLTKMSAEILDRKVQRGLSPRAVKKIVGLFYMDHDWYGKTEKEVAEMKWREGEEDGDDC